jgi:hypothetical protein
MQRAADHDRATVRALRGPLEQQCQDHRRELETVRHEAHDERAALSEAIHRPDGGCSLLSSRSVAIPSPGPCKRNQG